MKSTIAVQSRSLNRYRFKEQLLARRGAIDSAYLADIKLGPTKPDLHYLAMLDRRDQIAQLRQMPADDFEPNAS